MQERLLFFVFLSKSPNKASFTALTGGAVSRNEQHELRKHTGPLHNSLNRNRFKVKIMQQINNVKPVAVNRLHCDRL
jgi:hypothetical protein